MPLRVRDLKLGVESQRVFRANRVVGALYKVKERISNGISDLTLCLPHMIKVPIPPFDILDECDAFSSFDLLRWPLFEA